MQSPRARGITLMIVAVAVFSVMDMCLKVLSTHLGPLQMATVRGSASLPFVLLVVIGRGRIRDLRMRRPALHLLRGVLSVAMITTFSYAVSVMSLSTVYTLFMIAPLLVTAISVPLLGERVRPGAWVAILVGLGGVLILLHPSTTGIHWLGALASLSCAACYTVSYVSARFLARTESSDSLVFWVLAMMACISAVLGAPFWQSVQPWMWGWIGVIGVTGAIAQQCITRAFMLAPASVIAPFEYTALVWGAIIDYLVWSTHPTLSMALGALLIVASGVYVMLYGHGDPGDLKSGELEPHP